MAYLRQPDGNTASRSRPWLQKVVRLSNLIHPLHSEKRFGTNYPTPGTGFLAGEFPGGTTTVEGVPTQAEVRVLWRGPAGHAADGVLVSKTQSAPDGTWRVEGLNPNLRYDVVGRKDGFNDVIESNVQPVRTNTIDVVGGFAVNELGTSVKGEMLILSGLPPFTLSVVAPLPTGFTPVMVGERAFIIDGHTTDAGVFESVIRVKAANGVFRDISVTLEVTGLSYYEHLLSLSPLAYWPMDEATLGPVLDHSGNNLHGTLSDTARVTLRGAPLRRGHAGAMGFCVDSIGTARVTAPFNERIQSLMDPGNSGTIAFWAKRTAWTTNSFVVALYNSPSAGTARFRVYGGTLTFETPQNTNRVAASGTAVLDEVFFVVARKDAGSSKCDLFVNGTWHSASMGWTDPPRAGTQALQFPATGSWNYYGMRGYLSDMALFDRALTNTEVEQLYALGLE